MHQQSEDDEMALHYYSLSILLLSVEQLSDQISKVVL